MRFKSMTREEFTFLYNNLPVKKLARALGYYDKNGKFHPMTLKFIQKRRDAYGLERKTHLGRPDEKFYWKDETDEMIETMGRVRKVLEKVRRDEYKDKAGDVTDFLADRASFKYQK